MKSLRGKRGEDLIFNGGKSMARMNRASVKLTFNNTKRVLAVDFDEVTIERVVHRDSANEYFINGSAVRLKDISELLSGAHIGSSGHHIISQGEADRILNANLKERREMIEDALGLKVYLYKREESQRKLQKTEENIKQVESLRKEIAPHIRFLEKQVEKVEKAREMRIQLEGMYLDYFKREHAYIEAQKAKLSDERRDPDKRIKELDTELEHAKDVLATSQHKDAKSDDVLRIERSLQDVRSLRDKLAREVGRIEGQITSEERTIRRQRELASSNDTKTVFLKDVEIVVEDIYGKIQQTETMEDVPSLREILSGIKLLQRGRGNFKFFKSRKHFLSFPTNQKVSRNTGYYC
jgi:chromosome segregation protein